MWPVRAENEKKGVCKNQVSFSFLPFSACLAAADIWYCKWETRFTHRVQWKVRSSLFPPSADEEEEVEVFFNVACLTWIPGRQSERRWRTRLFCVIDNNNIQSFIMRDAWAFVILLVNNDSFIPSYPPSSSPFNIITQLTTKRIWKQPRPPIHPFQNMDHHWLYGLEIIYILSLL